MLACPFDLRASRASGSVRLWCVSFLRFCPRQLCSALRPDAVSGGGRSGGGSPLSPSGLRWNDLCEAQAPDQRAVDREVLVGHQGRDPRLRDDRGQQALGNVAIQQAIPVLAEGGRIPHRRTHRQSDEPADSRLSSICSISCRSERTE